MKGNDVDFDEFRTLKKQTENEYKKILTVFCPALKSEVIFNTDGFHHLCYDNTRAERGKKVQRAKFIFLNKAVKIIEKTTTIQEFRCGICPVGKKDRSGLRKTKVIKWFAFWGIISVEKRTRIRVVVRQIGDGQFHFWSVMPFWNLSNGNRVIGSREVEDE